MLAYAARRMRLSPKAAILVACVAALGAAGALDRWAPPPSAEVARGSEACFASGLFERELVQPGGTVQRWAGERGLFRFRYLPPGPLVLTVAVHGHRAPVSVVVAGAILGTIEPRATSASFALEAPHGGALAVELLVEPFVARGGRRLGAVLDRVTISHAPASWPRLGLVFWLVLPAALVVSAGLLTGIAPGPALALAVGMTLLQCLTLAPAGVVRSDYTERLALGLSACAAAALAFARCVRGRHSLAMPWAFLAVLVALFVQGVAGTSPLMVVSDAVFHSHRLQGVLEGRLFPTSLTPGSHPYRFPYGVSFYVLLAPLRMLDMDGVWLVRHGAAWAGVAASGALYWLLAPGGPRRAALAVILLQLLPTTFELFSFGNLSNIFGQAMTVLFFAWWSSEGRHRWPFGAALLALGALAHLSSLIFLLALCSALVVVRGRDLRGDRGRLLALAAGLGIAILYYLHFGSLVADQLPRLLAGGLVEGASGGSGPAAGLARQARAAVGDWGGAALLLCVVGWPRAGRVGLDRDLLAYWLAGALLALVAAVSPLEVRYLYSLGLPVAVAAGTGLDRLLSGRWAGRLLGGALWAWQTALAASGIVVNLLQRYRP